VPSLLPGERVHDQRIYMLTWTALISATSTAVAILFATALSTFPQSSAWFLRYAFVRDLV